MAEKKPSILSETELTLEMKPADARKYFERGFQVLVEIAEDTKSSNHDRLDALRGISQYYTTLVMKDSVDESMAKIDNNQRRTLDEVRKLRRKPWDKDDEHAQDGEE
jgi:hypothetical protein